VAGLRFMASLFIIDSGSVGPVQARPNALRAAGAAAGSRQPEGVVEGSGKGMAARRELWQRPLRLRVGSAAFVTGVTNRVAACGQLGTRNCRGSDPDPQQGWRGRPAHR
jgi:hypothetical protein